jgi:CPA2 family monovalent cation:H+ antiporter-2
MTMWTLAAGDGPSALVVDLVIILAAAGIVSVVAGWLRLATVPAYLITGALIGPDLLGLVSDKGEVNDLGSLAIVLLMFGIGLHMDMTVLAGKLWRMIGLSTSAIVLTTLPLWPFVMALGAPAPSALAIAMSLSLSSTALVLRVLQQRRQMQRMSGRLSLAILIVQDLAVIGILIALPGIARWAGTGVVADLPEESRAGEALVGALRALGGIAGIFIVGRYVLPAVLRMASRGSSGETLMVLSVAFAIGSAAITAWLGLSPELGAFLGGFLLSSTPFRHHLSGQIGTVRDLFIAVFFTILGMALDPHVLIADWEIILLGTVVVMAVKGGVIAGACVLFGTTFGVGLQVGIGLCQVGEFALVILSVADEPELGLVTEEQMAMLVAIIVLSLLVTPQLMSLGERLSHPTPLARTAPWVATDALIDADQREVAHAESVNDRPHVIVAGFGVVGRAVADRMGHTDATVTIIEMNVETVRRQRSMGKSIVYGDTSDAEVLENAGIHHADVLAITFPDQESTLRACRVAKGLNPNVFIIARTNFLSRAMVAMNLGANEAVVEEMATAEAMDRVVERVIGAREAR